MTPPDDVNLTDAQIAAALPGSTWVEMPYAERLRWAVRYLDGMSGGAPVDGYVAFGIGADPFVNAKGKYDHKRFWQRFHRLSDGFEAMAKAALAEAAHARDVYVAPMLRTESERLKTTGAGGRWAWADLDGKMTPERLHVLRALGPTVRVISSGTGHHVYFELDAWTSPDDVERTNKALADLLDGDAKWSNESLLRLPGTFNHKPYVFHGHTPALVQQVKL